MGASIVGKSAGRASRGWQRCARLASGSVDVASVVVGMVLVSVTLMDVMDVPRFVTMVFMGVALMNIVVVRFRVMLVAITLVDIVDVPRFVTMVFVAVALVNVVGLHSHCS